MLKITKATPKKVLVDLYNHFRKEKEVCNKELNMLLNKNEMTMHRDNLKETKYKKVWDEYKGLTMRYLECSEYQEKIMYYLSRSNGVVQ